MDLDPDLVGCNHRTSLEFAVRDDDPAVSDGTMLE
jgi:hypothetical protein